MTRAAAAPVVVVGGQREVVVVLATEAELLVGPVDHVQSRTVTEKDFVVRYENRYFEMTKGTKTRSKHVAVWQANSSSLFGRAMVALETTYNVKALRPNTNTTNHVTKNNKVTT